MALVTAHQIVLRLRISTICNRQHHMPGHENLSDRNAVPGASWKRRLSIYIRAEIVANLI